MSLYTYDLVFEQGIPRSLPVSNWTDANGNLYPLVNRTARLQVRESAEAACKASPLIDLSTADGSITINAKTGVITCNFSESDTLALVPLNPYVVAAGGVNGVAAQYIAGVYELVVTDPQGVPASLVSGNVLVVPRVVR